MMKWLIQHISRRNTDLKAKNSIESDWVNPYAVARAKLMNIVDAMAIRDGSLSQFFGSFYRGKYSIYGQMPRVSEIPEDCRALLCWIFYLWDRQVVETEVEKDGYFVPHYEFSELEVDQSRELAKLILDLHHAVAYAACAAEFTQRTKPC